MVRTAAMPDQEIDSQVFVDSTGRRKRILVLFGFLVSLFAAAYIAVVGASLIQASDAALTTRATVSTSATTSTSAAGS